jgi:hypothetical protein
MSGKWFANSGQVIQTTAATVSACAALVALYFVLKSNNSLPKASFVFYASGAMFLLLVGIMIGRRSGAGLPTARSLGFPETVERNIRSSGDVTATGGSATATGGSVNLHLHPGTPAPVTLSPRPESEPIPLLEFVQYDCLALRSDDSLLRSEDAGTHLLTAKFRNPRQGVGRPTPTAYQVHAQLTYRSNRPAGPKEVCVHHGHWIGRYTHFAQFATGESQTLVVALARGERLTYTLENHNSVDPRTRRFRSGITILHAPKTVTLPDDVFMVEIALVSGEVTLYEHQFLLNREPDGTMRLA